MKIGLICAIESEIRKLLQDIILDRVEKVAGRTFYQGELYGQYTVLVQSGVGKVAVAVTTTLLIERFKAEAIIFVGTAGGIAPDLSIGDVVIAEQCVQHDFSVDSTPTFRIPMVEKSYFKTDTNLSVLALAVAHCYLNSTFLRESEEEHLAQFGIEHAKALTGTIASGDAFVATHEKKEWLRANIPNLLCVEMEGAATAQVCDAYDMPYAVIRVISDLADHQASFSFETFVEHMASMIVRGIVQELFISLG